MVGVGVQAVRAGPLRRGCGRLLGVAVVAVGVVEVPVEVPVRRVGVGVGGGVVATGCGGGGGSLLIVVHVLPQDVGVVCSVGPRGGGGGGGGGGETAGPSEDLGRRGGLGKLPARRLMLRNELLHQVRLEGPVAVLDHLLELGHLDV